LSFFNAKGATLKEQRAGVGQEKNGSLEIGVTKNLSHTDWKDFTEEHGFFEPF